MTATPPEKLGGKNVAAFLDMLAVSEGTDNGRQRHDRQVKGCAGFPRVLLAPARAGHLLGDSHE